LRKQDGIGQNFHRDEAAVDFTEGSKSRQSDFSGQAVARFSKLVSMNCDALDKS
jgi:hypothetical protein